MHTERLQHPTPEGDIEHHEKRQEVPCNEDILHLQDNRILQALKTLSPMHHARHRHLLQSLIGRAKREARRRGQQALSLVLGRYYIYTYKHGIQA